jgi:hypothetical protein
MHNLHNGYKLVKRKISQKKIENYQTTHWHVAAVKIWALFDL